MGYEIDIIGVGQEAKSGDAIAMRWENLFGPRHEKKVVIIDGGFRDSGQTGALNETEGEVRRIRFCSEFWNSSPSVRQFSVASV